MMYTPILENPILGGMGVDGAQIISVRTEYGISLKGWYFPVARANGKTVVFFHGNGQNIGSSYHDLGMMAHIVEFLSDIKGGTYE